ncbi:MAG: transcriptional regulator, partial [Alphaproteobacteria bacterium]|nr:transcriptional regulator [Alphaproteobacteria bacterium]
MEESDDREIHFAYAARNKEEAIFLDELEAIVADRNNITLYSFFSPPPHLPRPHPPPHSLPPPL